MDGAQHHRKSEHLRSTYRKYEYLRGAYRKYEYVRSTYRKSECVRSIESPSACAAPIESTSACAAPSKVRVPAQHSRKYEYQLRTTDCALGLCTREDADHCGGVEPSTGL